MPHTMVRGKYSLLQNAAWGNSPEEGEEGAPAWQWVTAFLWAVPWQFHFLRCKWEKRHNSFPRVIANSHPSSAPFPRSPFPPSPASTGPCTGLCRTVRFEWLKHHGKKEWSIFLCALTYFMASGLFPVQPLLPVPLAVAVSHARMGFLLLQNCSGSGI